MTAKHLVKVHRALQTYQQITGVIRVQGVEIGTYEPLTTHGGHWSHLHVSPSGTLVGKTMYGARRRNLTLEAGIDIFPLGASTILSVRDTDNDHEVFTLMMEARIQENLQWFLNVNTGKLSTMLLEEHVLPVTGPLPEQKSNAPRELQTTHVLDIIASISSWFSRLPK